jgi:hypothetical protein
MSMGCKDAAHSFCRNPVQAVGVCKSEFSVTDGIAVSSSYRGFHFVSVVFVVKSRETFV